MTRSLRIVAIGDHGVNDALSGSSWPGKPSAAGLAETVSERFEDCVVDFTFIGSDGTGSLLANMTGTAEDNALTQIGDNCDVVILSTRGDVLNLPQRAADPYEAMDSLLDDLTAVVDLIKLRTGAHVLIVNAATFDPVNRASTLYGMDEEPPSMRAHRIDLVALKASHLLGISIIDADRMSAEAGAANVIPSVLELNREGSLLIQDEAIRILEDYGFFDDRPLAPQVGNRKDVA